MKILIVVAVLQIAMVPCICMEGEQIQTDSEVLVIVDGEPIIATPSEIGWSLTTLNGGFEATFAKKWKYLKYNPFFDCLMASNDLGSVFLREVAGGNTHKMQLMKIYGNEGKLEIREIGGMAEKVSASFGERIGDSHAIAGITTSHENKEVHFDVADIRFVPKSAISAFYWSSKGVILAKRLPQAGLWSLDWCSGLKSEVEFDAIKPSLASGLVMFRWEGTDYLLLVYPDHEGDEYWDFGSVPYLGPYPSKILVKDLNSGSTVPFNPFRLEPEYILIKSDDELNQEWIKSFGLRAIESMKMVSSDHVSLGVVGVVVKGDVKKKISEVLEIELVYSLSKIVELSYGSSSSKLQNTLATDGEVSGLRPLPSK